jgi:hypothetical protein
LADCKRYVENNHHFLSDEIVSEVDHILDAAWNLIFMSMDLSGYFDDNKKDRAATLEQLKAKGAEHSLNWHLGSNLAADLETLGNGIKDLLRRLETLDKAVAKAG